MHSLIIHMPSATARAENAAKLLQGLPNASLVEAVNGRDPAQIAAVATAPGTLYRPHYPFALIPAEIGVFQSHRRCWQRIIDEGWDMAVIVEDDLEIDPPQFARALQLVADHATPEMYIRLPVKQRETPAHTLAEDGDMALILPKLIALQCCCQVVGRDAAARLLAASVQIDRPVDTWLQMHWATGQPVHTLLPNGNAEIAGQIGGSTIQQKTRTSGKLMREIKRAVYRARLHFKPQG
ncbi:glycosyl transferase family 25 [Sulfitobacter sp. SK012]|uniref:glycosyltransferase family 25 protein n=1 Tax=Sulfitobacter sp. SK012 TaxID=1389005 RepID=UPI000E0A2003|nr:glycosyltransferase family 25 protein [Sulfitobacter sp. SK012]AXI44931.1 glycosyl transferase family 25 [Sulfitobacter sp. SK012]